MKETYYNIYPKVQYGTEHRRACPCNRSVETLAGVPKHWSCIRACPRNRRAIALQECQSIDHICFVIQYPVLGSHTIIHVL